MQLLNWHPVYQVPEADLASLLKVFSEDSWLWIQILLLAPVIRSLISSPYSKRLSPQATFETRGLQGSTRASASARTCRSISLDSTFRGLYGPSASVTSRSHSSAPSDWPQRHF